MDRDKQSSILITIYDYHFRIMTTIHISEEHIGWRDERHGRHRIDGPAYIDCFVHRWIQYGECHREDGPAVEWYDGDVEWYLRGINMSEEEFKRRMS